MADQAEALWTKLANEPAKRGSRERAAYNLAEQNADDTSVEEGFAVHSPRWFACFASTYDYNLDTMTDGTVEDWSF